MGSRVSVLEGTPLYREIRSGPTGISVDFPPGHWVWEPVPMETSEESTVVPSDLEDEC